MKGILFTKEHKRKISIAKKGKPTWNKGVYGERNSNWRGGITYEPYSSDFNEKLKLKIRYRDNHTCQICGMTEEEHLIVLGDSLYVHHIDYNKKNSRENNLISLCNQCHSRTNYNREYWIDFFIKGKSIKLVSVQSR